MLNARSAFIGLIAWAMVACGGGGPDTPLGAQGLSADAPQPAVPANTSPWVGTWTGTLRFQGSEGNSCAQPTPEHSFDTPLTLGITGEAPRFALQVEAADPDVFGVVKPMEQGFLETTTDSTAQSVGVGQTRISTYRFDLKLVSQDQMDVQYGTYSDTNGGRNWCNKTWKTTLQRTAP
ncbi:hypothetical protein GCM10027034_27870 [Ramlibacter solisilvae]|uniref:Lipoprotein n=1 Tax=Ramlibacter tataouinensis TaxID=94132 RepID=A0A127JR52_9BURK|nr:hypothetical protein [Ramlibacter tataouinensis]AMO22431.1 hypothetical protein UC35_05360 [Ramlibacter tataouinensis]